MDKNQGDTGGLEGLDERKVVGVVGIFLSDIQRFHYSILYLIQPIEILSSTVGIINISISVCGS